MEQNIRNKSFQTLDNLQTRTWSLREREQWALQCPCLLRGGGLGVGATQVKYSHSLSWEEIRGGKAWGGWNLGGRVLEIHRDRALETCITIFLPLLSSTKLCTHKVALHKSAKTCFYQELSAKQFQEFTWGGRWVYVCVCDRTQTDRHEPSI